MLIVAVGIDLGTTFSVVGVNVNGKVDNLFALNMVDSGRSERYGRASYATASTSKKIKERQMVAQSALRNVTVLGASDSLDRHRIKVEKCPAHNGIWQTHPHCLCKLRQKERYDDQPYLLLSKPSSKIEIRVC